MRYRSPMRSMLNEGADACGGRCMAFRSRSRTTSTPADRMMTTAGSLALQGAPAPRDAFIVYETSCRGRRGSWQDKSERMGQLPFDEVDQRLERARRSSEQSVCARPESMRVELGNRRRCRSKSECNRHGYRDRWIDRLSVRRERPRRVSSRRSDWSAAPASFPYRTLRTRPVR